MAASAAAGRPDGSRQHATPRTPSKRRKSLRSRAEHQHAPGACALLATLLARTTTVPVVSVTADAAIVEVTVPASSGMVAVHTR